MRNLVTASLVLPGPWMCAAVVYNGRYFEPLHGLGERQAEGRVGYVAKTRTDRLRRAFHRVRSEIVRAVPAASIRDALHSQRVEYGLRRVVYSAQNSWRWLRSFREGIGPRIDFRAGDVLVLLDSTWNVDMTRELRRAQAAGVTIWVVVNDLIPIEQPDLAPEGTPILVDKWLRRTLPCATGVLAISRAVADALRAHLARRPVSAASGASQNIDYFYLGAGLDRTERSADGLDVSAIFRDRERTVYLVVGTIEPRKNHARILSVFDRLWNEGSETTLLIMGRLGWRSDELAQRIRMHPQFGKRLVWFDTASDAELEYAYRNASALIFASICEGFGLPLVEAMQFGLPVLASDIAVFREIGEDYPDYFDPVDERSLSEAIRRFEAARVAQPPAQRRARPWLSWADSARMLLEKVSAAPRN